MDEEIISKFKEVGYSTSEDVEHLKQITEKELEIDIGIMKPGAHANPLAMSLASVVLLLHVGHRKRLTRAIKLLRMESNGTVCMCYHCRSAMICRDDLKLINTIDWCTVTCMQAQSSL